MKKSRLQHPFVRHVNFAWQAACVYACVALFALLPWRVASNVGGFLGRTIGPRLGVARRAARHVDLAFPEKAQHEKRAIMVAMWDNLGRNVAEAVHLRTIKKAGVVDVDGFHHVTDTLTAGRPVLIVTGHFSNWEVGPMSCVVRGLDVATVYRPPNNPYVDALVRYLRRPVSPVLFPKGREGARGIMRWLRDGKAAGLLVDQKMNDGIAVPFFGRPAMTPDAPAQMALLTNAAMIPMTNTRIGKHRFKLVFHPELRVDTPKTDKDAFVRDLTTAMNMFLESHIRIHPGQWLWLHRRWGNMDHATTYNQGDDT